MASRAREFSQINIDNYLTSESLNDYAPINSPSFTGTVSFPSGSASAPSISAFGDANTGIFFPSADTLALSEGGTEAMRIDSSGRIIKPYQPYARVRYSGASNFTLTSGQVIVFNTANVNIGSCYNTSSGRFTAPVSGKYFVSASLELSVSANSSWTTNTMICVNGSTILGTYESSYAASYFPGRVTGIVDCNQNDYIDIRVLTNISTSIEVNPGDPRNFCTFMLIG